MSIKSMMCFELPSWSLFHVTSHLPISCPYLYVPAIFLPVTKFIFIETLFKIACMVSRAILKNAIQISQKY